VLLFSGKWHNGFGQRFGFFSGDIKAKMRRASNIWVHAVSVGEVNAIAGLIHALKNAHSDHQIILTVSTKTGHKLALEKLEHHAVVMWAPLDFAMVVQGFVRLIDPKIYVVAETELWPNLFTCLNQRGVPIVLVNGRISDNSYGRYLKIRWLIKKYLGYVTAYCMQSDRDVERIKAIGAPEDRVSNIGNVKFDDVPMNGSFGPVHFGFEENTTFFIAGSTHPGEEEIVLKAFQKIKDKYPAMRLVIAPRHIERADDIKQLIKSCDLDAFRFSQMIAGMRYRDQVVILDTIGHLRAFYDMATLVFVGKSLTVQGGHNIIEPAYFSKPIIVGPHVQNFRDVVSAFKDDNAIVQVENAREFEAAVSGLLDDPGRMAELGKKARGVIERHRGATNRSVEVIGRALKGAL
jgi:3-deoxy-D-manno-octulosonic-acid transferase